MHYSKKLDNLNYLIEIIIKFNNKLYKLAIEIYYTNFNNKAKFYRSYTFYYIDK